MAGYNPVMSSKLEKGNDLITANNCMLFQACEKKEALAGGQSKEEVITMVMQVFVDAYTHIPEHRRLMLFSRLVEIVGGDNFLWRCVLLKMAHEITRPASEPTEVRSAVRCYTLQSLCTSLCIADFNKRLFIHFMAGRWCRDAVWLESVMPVFCNNTNQLNSCHDNLCVRSACW